MINLLKKAVAMMGVCILGSLASVAGATEKESLWSNAQDKGVLRCGAAASPPYVIRDPKTGEYSGVYVDLCSEFAEKYLGVKAEFVDTTWDNIIAGLQANKWDLSLSLNRKPKRAMAINFSTAPLYDETSLAYNTKNPKIPANPTSIADFDKEGVIMAVMSGSAADHGISAFVQNATVMRLPGVDEVRLAVMSRRADVIVENGVTNALFVKKNDWADHVYPKPALIKQGIGFGFRKSVPMEEIEVFNIFLEEKVAKGDIQRLYDSYVDQLLSSK